MFVVCFCVCVLCVCVFVFVCLCLCAGVCVFVCCMLVCLCVVCLCARVFVLLCWCWCVCVLKACVCGVSVFVCVFVFLRAHCFQGNPSLGPRALGDHPHIAVLARLPDGCNSYSEVPTGGSLLLQGPPVALLPFLRWARVPN